jgi:hypothetical protein
VWGMDAATLGAIAASTVLILAVLRHFAMSLEARLVELDTNLAQVIQSVMGNIPVGADFEPPNPIQAVIAQLLHERMSPPAPVVVEKDAKGRFTSPKPAN